MLDTTIKPDNNKFIPAKEGEGWKTPKFVSMVVKAWKTVKFVSKEDRAWKAVKFISEVDKK